MKPSSKVLIIYTGGTIGMAEDLETGTLHPLDFDHLLNEIPELKKLYIAVAVHSVETAVDSSNVDPDHWVSLLKVLEENYSNYDGFVVLHGTDTMAFTASAISFLLENVSKPIIFTGSQLPIGQIRTDGKENILTAIEIAGANEKEQPIVPEVAIYFENALYRANRTTKVSAENFEAFQSPNYPLLAKAGVHIKYNRFVIQKPTPKTLKARTNITTNVASIRLYPGIQEANFKAISQMKNLEGLIIETFGSGNAPTYAWLDEELRRLVQSQVLVMNVTQCVTGKVIQGKYETGVHLERAGVISGGDITFEAAITKMMYVLSCKELSFEEKMHYIGTNLRGEMS